MATRAQAWGAAMLMILILIVGQGMEARGQERVFDISGMEPVQATEGISRMGRASVMASVDQRSATPSLSDDKKTVLSQLYFDVQPALYFESGSEVLDGTDGMAPSVLFVQTAAMNNLQQARSNHDFNAVRLIVIDGSLSGALPSFILDDKEFPSLEFVMFRSSDSRDALTINGVNRAVAPSVEARENVIFLFNNLTEK